MARMDGSLVNEDSQRYMWMPGDIAVINSPLSPTDDDPAPAPAGDAEKATEPLTWVQRLRRTFGLPGSQEDGD